MSNEHGRALSAMYPDRQLGDLQNPVDLALRSQPVEAGDVEREIAQRDAAEDALSSAYEAVVGRPVEWSNLFGYADALAEIRASLQRAMNQSFLAGARDMRERAAGVAEVTLRDDGTSTIAFRQKIAKAIRSLSIEEGGRD